MIIEMFYLEENKTIVAELTPETNEEEESLRNAKILHKNNLMVAWGDTLDFKNRDKFVGYSGLKLYFNLPKEELVVSKLADSLDSEDIWRR